MSLSDDELKKLREIHGALDPLMRAIIDEALSRGARLAEARCVYCLATMPVEEAPAHVQSCPARADLQEREIRGLIAALAKAEREERDALKERARWAADNHCQPDNPCWEECSRGRVEHARIAANARAVAFEEAAQEVQWIAALGDKTPPLILGSEAVKKIRALSSSPPSGQWVAADVMERVKAALEEVSQGFESSGFGDAIRERVRAALSALESEASR